MQENFKGKLSMTGRKGSLISKCVKILEDAKARLNTPEKAGTIPDVQRWLLKVAGVEVSSTALYDAESGKSQSLKPRVIVALVHLAYGGDWKKGGKALETDFLPEGLQ